MRLFTALKVAASILFIWIHNRPNAPYTSGKYIGGPYNIEIISDIRFQRSLAEQEFQEELDQLKIPDKTLKDSPDNSAKWVSDDLSEHEQLQESCSNDLEIYKEKFKHKYAKWKGLKRLDGYFEKNIFDKIDRIRKQEGETGVYNRTVIKNIIKKRDILIMVMPPILLIVLLPTIIITALSLGLYTHIFTIYGILLLILACIISFSIIYTMVKVLKYYRLEVGGGKLKFKEYCALCKDIFFP
ncbi:Variable surface protein Vir10-like [Plasmodium coatneyi]|uniref:Variable surface protein Vir10-like n=1 Tax=Plasmodium coatneyi TaxID=208452 RepID=A0A1B1E6C7_9APIC|nr:Variable surface protein Vir10-like [Plasmodium coatneyi]ANQ10527.1 Variable surface protein Vir10-like [Plasmodium coatneyi]